MHFASALLTQFDSEAAVPELAAELRGRLGEAAIDLAVVFTSGLSGLEAIKVIEALRMALEARVFLACTAEGVIGAEHEVERRPAASVLAAALPGVTLTPLEIRPAHWSALIADPATVGVQAAARLIVLLADPFSTPMDEVLTAFNHLRPGVPVIGGMASGARRPGENVLVCDERVLTAGAVGVALSGAFEADVIVSQGCRPVGQPFRVTAADRNLIRSLEGQPSVEQVRALYTQLSPEEQALMQNGLFIGRAVTPEVEAPGRGDFLIRGVMGIERETGALAIGDVVPEGETVQFQVMDAATAQEDLELLLAPHAFADPPAGALLFSCNGRGTHLYNAPDGDIRVIGAALGPVPLAGFFCAGELGPIGGRNFLHGHTASLVLFRPAP